MKFVSATCAGCGRQITVVPLSRVTLCGSCVTRTVDPALAAKLTVETPEPLFPSPDDARTPVRAAESDAPAMEPAERTPEPSDWAEPLGATRAGSSTGQPELSRFGERAEPWP